MNLAQEKLEAEDAEADRMLDEADAKAKAEAKAIKSPDDIPVTPEAQADTARPAKDTSDEAIQLPIAVSASKPPVTPDGSADEMIALKKEVDRLRKANATLQGKYTAELPRLSAELRELKAKQAEMDEKARNVVPAYKTKLLPEEQELEEADALGTQGRAAAGVAKQDNEQLRREFSAKNEALESELKAIRGQQDLARFMTRVDQHVPGASALNQTAEFIEWLESGAVDPMSGNPWKDLGTKAMNDSNVRGVVSVFEAYLKENPAPVITKSNNARVIGQVKPDVSSTDANRSAPQLPILKRSQVDAFLKKASRGGFGSDPEGNPEYVARLKVIEQADTDGRIINDV